MDSFNYIDNVSSKTRLKAITKNYKGKAFMWCVIYLFNIFGLFLHFNWIAVIESKFSLLT